MKATIRWAIKNSPAMNTLMVSILLLGVLGTFLMRRETFPEFELEIVLVQVAYPGASPEEVETGICQKIEEAVRSIDGIKKQTAVAAEGVGSMVLELKTGANVQKVLNEVRSEVDRIPSFPEQAEDPEVKQVTMRQESIHVGVLGPEIDGSPSEHGEWVLRELTEQIRDDLILKPNVSQAELVGARDYQIDVEISEKTLEKYNLTRQMITNKIRMTNIELPGGTIKTEGQHIRVKVDNKYNIADQIEEIPIISDGLTTIRLKDIGKVRDGFIDTVSRTRINNRPAMAIKVSRTSQEDLILQADTVEDYVKEQQAKMPPGYELIYWDDRSVDVEERMELLSTNGLQGLFLVLVVLALFLETRLAFWVAMGIPISILGACAVLYLCGQTLNMLSMFAFLMALGIVVDDAIVVGENIYSRRQKGEGFILAAINGTIEVLPSVATSVATTVVAFMPLFFVTGILGKFIAVMPLAMIAMLVISLFECVTILPCHLAHGKKPNEVKKTNLQKSLDLTSKLPPLFRWTLGLLIIAIAAVLDAVIYPFLRLEALLGWISNRANRILNWVGDRIYVPTLGLSLKNPATVLSIAVVLLLFTAGLFVSGLVKWEFFPKFDSKGIAANIAFEDGTDAEVTEKAVDRLEAALWKLNKKYADEKKPIVNLVHRGVGYSQNQNAPGQATALTASHYGMVRVELVDNKSRDVTSQQIIAEWRKMAGSFPEAEQLKFSSTMGGPGGTPIEFRLLSRPKDFDKLKAAVAKVKAKLAEFDGVVDIADDSPLGKLEIQLKTKKEARYKDVTEMDLAETVRSFYGQEAMRIQRERFEIKIMVRLPREERQSRENLYDLQVPIGTSGEKRYLRDVAEITEKRTLAEINRVDQLRSITISADVEGSANAKQIVSTLKKDYLEAEFLEEYPELSIRWEGQQQQTAESFGSLGIGMAVALLVMFILLVIEFRSYFQPLLIMAIIPFGLVGAVLGHGILDMPFSMFSLFGVIALTGVVVNDSIVLIDFINHRVRDDKMPLREALLDAGRQRLRPIFLTSITTVAGLLPLMLEKSFQAQILIPMAVSLCFGLMLTTILVLFLVPTFYYIYGSLFQIEESHEEEEGPTTPQQESEDLHTVSEEDLAPVGANGTNVPHHAGMAESVK